MLFEKALWLEEDKHMCLECKGKSKNWSVDCSFDAGKKETEDDWSVFGSFADSLCRRLNNLCKKAEEPFDTNEKVMSDNDELSVFAGNVYAISKIEKGHLLFEIDFRSIGGAGEVRFDFGEATESRVKGVSSLIYRMYDFLPSFTYFVKHHYIDTAIYDDFEDDKYEDEE